MGNNIYNFQWYNSDRICNGTMKMENDDLILTCTDTQLDWVQDLEKICFHYDKTKAVCIIEDIGSVLSLKKNKIILKIEKKFSAGHICAIYFWTNKCVATIKLKECTAVYGKIIF